MVYFPFPKKDLGNSTQKIEKPAKEEKSKIPQLNAIRPRASQDFQFV